MCTQCSQLGNIFSLLHLYDVPITVAALSKTWTVFTRSNTVNVGLNPTRGMDFCVRIFSFVLFCVKVAALRRTDPRPRSHTDCVQDQEAEKAAKVQEVL
jgi:hypothetical protein